MMTNACEAGVEAMLIDSGFAPLTREERGWIALYCRHGLGKEWITFRLIRLLARKDFIEHLKMACPWLSDGDLGDLGDHARDFLNGDDVIHIYNNAERARGAASDSQAYRLA